jgi:hypothetical protein
MTEIPASEIGPIGWRNWRAQATSAPGRGESIEFAIYSDAHLTEGNFELGPYTIINAVGSSGPIGNVQLGLVLRVADYLPDERSDYDWSRTDTTHYHGGGIAEELAALIALSLGRRFRAGGSIREFDGEDDRFGRIWTDGFDRPFLAKPRGLPFRPGGIPMLPGIADMVRLGTALPFLEIYPTLELGAAVPLLRAARRFEEALWIADGDPQTSWLLLIAAVETAAAQWATEPTPEQTLEEWWPELWDVFQQAPDVPPKLVKEMANLIKSGKRFRDFLMAHLPDPPEKRPQHGRLDWGQMRHRLRAIYEARSRAIHSGIPLPVPMVDHPRSLGEDNVPAECAGAPTAAQGGVWRPEDAPMHLHVFAYIVGNALRQWWLALGQELTASDCSRGD